MSDNGDQLAADYLRRLSAAVSHLPEGRRQELVEEITANIAEARSVAAPGSAGVRAVLDQLGDPEEIVRAEATTGTGWPLPRGRAPGFEIVAVILLLIGGIVVPLIGWIVGVVLLWTSSRWRTSDKVLGTLVWPGGLAAPLAVLFLGAGAALFPTGGCAVAVRSTGDSSGHVFATHATSTCTTPIIPLWLGITVFAVVFLAAIAGPVLVAIRLLRRARSEPVQPPGSADQGILYTVT